MGLPGLVFFWSVKTDSFVYIQTLLFWLVVGLSVSLTAGQKGGAKGAMRNRGGKGGGSNRGGRGRNVEDEWDGQYELGELTLFLLISTLQCRPSSSTTTTPNPDPVSASATSWSWEARLSQSIQNILKRRGRPAWGCVTGTGWRESPGGAGGRRGRRRGRSVLEPVIIIRKNRKCLKRNSKWKRILSILKGRLKLFLKFDFYLRYKVDIFSLNTTWYYVINIGLKHWIEFQGNLTFEKYF